MNNKDIFNICLAKKLSGGSPAPTPTYEDKTLTPDFSNGDVIVNPDEGYDALSSVTIQKDADLVAENIKKDVEVFGITGTLDAGVDTGVAITEGTLVNLNNDATSVRANAFYRYDTLQTVDLPNATSVGDGAFNYCSNLTSIDLPNVTTAGRSAFEWCSSLTSINIPNVTRIDMYALAHCSSLTSINLPNVTELSQWSLQYNPSLTSIILRKDSVCVLYNINAFTSTPFASDGTGGTLYVPQSLIESYQSANNWSTILGYPNNQIKAIEGSIYE